MRISIWWGSFWTLYLQHDHPWIKKNWPRNLQSIRSVSFSLIGLSQSFEVGGWSRIFYYSRLRVLFDDLAKCVLFFNLVVSSSSLQHTTFYNRRRDRQERSEHQHKHIRVLVSLWKWVQYKHKWEASALMTLLHSHIKSPALKKIFMLCRHLERKSRDLCSLWLPYSVQRFTCKILSYLCPVCFQVDEIFNVPGTGLVVGGTLER